jgi:hypothetical protein
VATIVRSASSMEQPVRDHPTPEAVPSSTAVRTIERTGDQRLGRAVVIGCTIGVFAMTALVFGIGMFAGFGAWGSLGMGLFCAVWGGLGFGAMFASVFVGTREEQRERDAGPDAPPSTGLWF